MGNLHYTTTTHQKGKHLSFEERVIIQTRMKDNFSIQKIAQEIGCSRQTIYNEIKRGTVELYKGNVKKIQSFSRAKSLSTSILRLRLSILKGLSNLI